MMSPKLIAKNINKVSKLFQPIKIYPKEAVIQDSSKSKSYRLMEDVGIIQQANPGMYTLLPLGNRALAKLTALIDVEMESIGAQKMLMPCLTDAKLWKKSDRFPKAEPELFKLKDRHHDLYLLNPTNEELITTVLLKAGLMTKNLMPLLLYQISTKFRDEMKPRQGFFRSREFIMKDLYSFDMTLDDAQNSYDRVNQAYANILTRIGLPYTVALGDNGLIGGSLSHEYHYLSDVGEDTIFHCTPCDSYVNAVVQEDNVCKKCQKEMTEKTGIEVAHTFLLGDKYTKLFDLKYLTQDSRSLYQMGCYGIGLTRLIAAAVEISSSMTKEDGLRWPECIAPFTVCIIPPKEHSKDSEAIQHIDNLIEILTLNNVDFIIDDRTNMSIGRRLIDARRTGYPYLLVIGKSASLSSPKFEFHDLNQAVIVDRSLDQLADFFSGKKVVDIENDSTSQTRDKQHEDFDLDNENLKLKSIEINITTKTMKAAGNK